MKKLILAFITLMGAFAFANYGVHEWGREPMLIITLLMFCILGMKLQNEQ